METLLKFLTQVDPAHQVLSEFLYQSFRM